MPIKRLLQAGELFNIEPATMRVAAARLVKEGLLETPQRAVYQTGAKSRALTAKLQSWQSIEDKTKPWTGDWRVAVTHHVGRTDRKLLRAHIRTFELNGFAEALSGLWVRPNNLITSLEDHHQELVAIGMDPQVLLMHISDVRSGRGEDWTSLWSVRDLKKSYQSALKAMEKSLSVVGGMSVPAAARETLLVGQSVIRVINFDPLLPGEIAAAELFSEVVEAMTHYNAVGQQYWERYQVPENTNA